MRLLAISIFALSLFHAPMPAAALTYLQEAQPQQAGNKQNNPSTPAPTVKLNPSPSDKYPHGKDVSAPVVIHWVDAVYPHKARHKHVEGTSVIGLTVDEKGNPQNIYVFQSITVNADPKMQALATEMNENAVKAVMQYRFKPAIYQGKPVPSEINIDVNYPPR